LTQPEGSSLNLRKEKRSSALKINNCKKTYHYIIKCKKKYRFIQSLSPGIRAGFLIFNLVFMRYSCAALNDATMGV
jgi:hypothetical protein